ncbi:hypothetical protein [Zooshikella harenae]|uniref:Uncharacterized protein n=1 Tax=Zooshikella harenae TaxID=2827238 RepID=A0ABS5ZI27_9GAMM|nr:hypothetical protein [Zooshikella harenae]MBU2713726.1 hypothetical protein [Zooshikella harenae]
MSFKGSLKLTLFIPIIGPIVILLITGALLLLDIDKHGFVEDIYLAMSVNCVGLVLFFIPYLIATAINIIKINKYSDRQAFWSTCFFPLRVVILSLIGTFIVILFNDGTRIFTHFNSYINFLLGVVSFELVLGVPWLVLSLITVYYLNRDTLKKPA